MVRIYTDGACRSNPDGVGGWAFVVVSGSRIVDSDCGAIVRASNNQAELMAVIKALEYGHEKRLSGVHVISDSAYVVNCFKQGWWRKWMRNGWIGSQGTAVKNQGLWKRLLRLYQDYEEIKFSHVKGHSGNPFNEEADRLAGVAIEQMQKGERKGFDIDFEDEGISVW